MTVRARLAAGADRSPPRTACRRSRAASALLPPNRPGETKAARRYAARPARRPNTATTVSLRAEVAVTWASRANRNELRVSSEHNDRIERAAAVTRPSLTAFAISNRVERAREVSERAEVTTLRRHDFEALLAVSD
ncbi:MAG: DUF1778 domain-containing protein [Planctomycetota bacterium]|nr:MAG: DUF1778 domain-containing protein [Planctomycetota bacterium]